MSTAKEPFFRCIESTLRAALCILHYPSTCTDGEAVPEVELDDALLGGNSPPLISSAQATSSLRGNPLRLRWTQGDECFIETAHNSTRVSLWFAAAHQPGDLLTGQLLQQYISFFCTHGTAAAPLSMLRREPVRSKATAAADKDAHPYDVSFLVLPEHVESHGREALVSFIVTFVRGVEADVAGLKVSLNARRRAAAQAFFAPRPPRSHLQ
ncbi:putative ARP2/3 complex subunit [Leptomonas pyrrhocoris]|uniref:Putative ARP2/3 complex subunit n=1 Tax=Leptomonas pyrrhocoris TaxID=157538 RepID=A0A0M9FQB0_LEPPY|nr:putative ARP2/3 complex subunit [Leptomonas pyrrhocoris]KPA73803.1 putative ARP2/3 complex subunit [Leptomonas pyrrhocoris]|eukprot:XP_015652242.1 putative ARP2/3 complex subunit [Leptomonas pyrrhocoris]